MKSTDSKFNSKHEKALSFDGEETNSRNDAQKSDITHKEKNKKSYRPLNITKSVVLPSKHADLSTSEVLSDTKLDAVCIQTPMEG